MSELLRIRSEFEWSLTPRKAIQGVRRLHDRCRVFDPVTAVAYCVTQEFYPRALSRQAARRLGLSFSHSTQLVAACQYAWHDLSPLGVMRRTLVNLVMEAEKPATTIH